MEIARNLNTVDWCKLAVVFVAVLQVGVADTEGPFSVPEKENIKYWADELGEELWKLGQSLTRATEIKARYKKLNVQVQEKDGETLLSEIAESVQSMLDHKMDAVKCIMNVAEDAAEAFNRTDVPENYTFYSAKYSFIVGEEKQSKHANNNTYTPMELYSDDRFYNIPVNLNYSMVHVPTNVYDLDEQVLDVIKWSEALDDIFKQNYFSDPGLSFQYFGSSLGVMRSYPAMKWKQEIDLFDCRNRFWYIEAASCSKDIVILMDNSGSMTGYRHTIARRTVSNILDTLNNNDFVNVFNYSEGADEVVPCFKDMLIQATLENLDILKASVEEIRPEGYANLTYAFTKAFQLLEKYRELRGCSNSSSGVQCNQAVMLVTDGVTGNHTEVFEAWNWKENSSHIPVRVFTFLIGQEVMKVREIQWMACLNRGYYVHIHSINEVREQVLRYIPVFARPLVLQGAVHPTFWTPAYADTADPTLAAWLWDVMDTRLHRKHFTKRARAKDQYFSQGKADHVYIRDPSQPDGVEEPTLQEYRVMVSVTVPAFDRKVNSFVTNETRFADLLGVAGTDIPIKDIERLTFNFKSGVNGYAFIVTNNGYVLLHPDLRPVFNGVLKKNYNSIDLTEVELLDDTNGARKLSPEIEELRNAMVNHSKGKMLKLRMKFHYDDIRRVAVEHKNYYFVPLNGTPFTLGLSIPDKYGMYYIKAGDEVQKSRHRQEPIIDYLKGSDWKIHPDWTYCKYHYQTRVHVFESPEDEMKHFLDKMKSPDWVWAERYERTEHKAETMLTPDSFAFFADNGTESVNCNRRPIGENEYYCDKELVQLFVFDARVTQPFFGQEELTDLQEELVELYNVTVKFVSTQSGLTRWLNLQKRTESEEGALDFGDLHSSSIDEPYYRSAVLQHEYDQEAYVFSVPFDADRRDDAAVIASHAIFPRDGGMEAPASVVGLQFQHSALLSRFMNITSKTMCPICKDCASEELDCFVLDHNGYVVLAENKNLTGQFFGHLEGPVMDSLRTDGAVYRKVPMFDYQGLCTDEETGDSSSANFILTPFTQLTLLVHWMFGQLLWLLFECNLSHLWYSTQATAATIIEGTKVKEQMRVPRPCDLKTSLYLLQYEGLSKYEYTDINCSRPHLVQRIPHTNLVLIVIKSMFRTCERTVTSSPAEMHYNATEYPCHKLLLNALPRRRMEGCFSENPLEHEVKLCGGSGRVTANISLFVMWCVMCLRSILYH